MFYQFFFLSPKYSPKTENLKFKRFAMSFPFVISSPKLLRRVSITIRCFSLFLTYCINFQRLFSVFREIKSFNKEASFSDLKFFPDRNLFLFRKIKRKFLFRKFLFRKFLHCFTRNSYAESSSWVTSIKHIP